MLTRMRESSSHGNVCYAGEIDRNESNKGMILSTVLDRCAGDTVVNWLVRWGPFLERPSSLTGPKSKSQEK